MFEFALSIALMVIVVGGLTGWVIKKDRRQGGIVDQEHEEA